MALRGGVWLGGSGDLADEVGGALVRIRRSYTLLGGSWVVISGVISPLIWVITIVTLLIGPLITTHEPPSRGSRSFELRV